MSPAHKPIEQMSVRELKAILNDLIEQGKLVPYVDAQDGLMHYEPAGKETEEA